MEVDLGFSDSNRELRKILRFELNTVLKNRPGSRQEERVFAIALVEPFSIENGLITPTMKVKRNKVVAKYKNILENFYKK